jgi:hypothetical protein
MPNARATGTIAPLTPQADQAEGAPLEFDADRALPAPGAQARVLGGDRARQREDQAPGEFARRARVAAGAADGDAIAPRGLQVDRGVRHAGRHQQTQVGQGVQPIGGEGGALAHRHDHVEVAQGGDEDGGVGEVLAEDPDRAVGQTVPVGVAQGDPLVIIQDGDVRGHRWLLPVTDGVTAGDRAVVRDREVSTRPAPSCADSRTISRSGHITRGDRIAGALRGAAGLLFSIAMAW